MKYLVLTCLALAMTACQAQQTTKSSQDIHSTQSVYDEKLALELGADDYGMRQYVMVVLMTGPNGFDRKLWKITPSKDKLEAVLKTQSMSGFPGQLEVQVRFELSQQRLRLSLRAVSDQSTPINMTYHPYWNLKGKGKIDDHDLHLISAGQTAYTCLLYTSPSPRDLSTSRMPSSA